MEPILSAVLMGSSFVSIVIISLFIRLGCCSCRSYSSYSSYSSCCSCMKKKEKYEIVYE